MMFKLVQKLGLLGSLMAISGVAAADMPAISEISVATSYAAATDTNAVRVFPQISDDLRAAIAARVPTSNDAGDPRISVDIRRIALNGNAMIPDTGEFNELEGVVSISSQDRSIGDLAFPVRVAAVPGDVSAPEGYIVIPPSTGDYYNVMINAFAELVATELDDVNTSGDGVTK